ncbi:methionine ABC transporter permease [Enterococcus rivorum]|uniref:Methionine ABC transporter ATP-binding protein n=1 Tax=Enterococcus rivorum TaxID=762845 RepID=A0A1E5L0V9_9ENTE|nr:methionine ABC transporter permease [Enterococcus rivorum]MBP2098652.1 D-methionine transport system permease protein [Enterococcus rivorum]OEH83747.1 methionine ABC transporter ATP-binding protein [Enterococcus rivorum]
MTEKLTYYFPELLKALSESGIMLLISTTTAVLIGLPVGTFIYLAGLNTSKKSRLLSVVLNAFVDIVRSFPFLLLVVALIPFTRSILGTAFGTYAASFPLSIVSIALYARLVEQVLLEVPAETIELAKALGSTKSQFIFRFLYVEARSGLVLTLTSVVISLVSYSTVMGVVGGGGIGDFAMRYGYQRYEYEVMYTAIMLMILFVSTIQFLGSRVAKKIDKKH